MQLECASCGKKLNIPPTAKLPVGRPFSFTCPSCGQKNTVTIDPEAGGQAQGAPPPPAGAPAAPGPPPMMGQGPPPPQPFAEAPGPQAGPGPAAAAPPPPPPAGGAPGFNNAEVQRIREINDMFGEGSLSALVIYDSEDVQALLNEKLTAMGYQVILALNVRDAAKQLKFGSYRVVLLQADYYGANLRSNQLIKAISSLELAVRRRMFIGVIGPDFTSLDDLTAFSLSMDAVFNTRDLDNIEQLLISATGHVAKFFETYNELRLARGVD